MIHFANYIFESQTTASMKIDYKTFKRFVDNVETCVNANEFIDEYNDDKCIEQLRKNGASDTTINTLFEFVHQFMFMFVHTLKQSYDFACKTLYDTLSTKSMKYVTSMLGSGCEGFACALNDDRVVKVYFTQSIDTRARKFFDYARTHWRRYSALPHIDRIGASYVIMERLSIGNDACEDFYWNVKHNIDKYKRYVKNERKYRKEIDALDSDGINALSFVREIVEMFNALGEDVEGRGMFGDFTPSNIGQRRDGSFVFFDI